MPITIQPCDHGQLLDRMSELAVGHWQETESMFSGNPPEPDRAMYDALASVGGLLAFSATDDGELIGYASAFFCRHPHYDMAIVQHDTLYLMPAYRQGSVGLRLIAAIEKEAKERGAERMLWTAKTGSTFERILQGKGYQTEETIYCKEL